ncbi:hypothetical protein B484DRAFT_447009 [Ochromonadaceae sp. CCMP2298]|nr:hypothetical protein B484DRAFT_447009 [Ochromonadaceae sp. CCMP2298]
MGAIGDFTVLAGSAITTTGGDISGDVGVSPGTAITKAGTTITGSLNSATAAAAAAKVALTAAYTEAQGKTADQDLSGQGLGGLTLTQGVYSFAAAATVDGVLTLQGDATAVWIFQIGSTVLFAPGSSIVMSGGGNPDRVYWQVGSSATATGATVVGNVMAYAAITATGSTVQGRLLARTAAVTLLSNTINLPYVPTAAPTFAPSLLPSFPPTHAPSFLPTWVSMAPTQSPTFAPSAPTVVPTSSPPSTSPTYVPTSSPTVGICGINRAGTLPVGNVADAEGWETGPNGKQYCFSYTGYTLLRHPFADCEAHCAGLEASMICLMDKAEADYVIAHQASTEFVWLYANAVPEGEGSEGSSWMEGCASTYVGDWYAPRYEYTPSNIATVVVMGTPLFADYAGKIMTIDPRQNGIAGCGCEKAAPQTRHLRSG